jgi:hypothetical protein
LVDVLAAIPILKIMNAVRQTGSQYSASSKNVRQLLDEVKDQGKHGGFSFA